LTGRGLEDVRERIRRAFEQVHGGAAPLPREEKQPQVYTETQRERFHERVKALSLPGVKCGPRFEIIA
jgi:hypothetical protein